MKQKGNTLIVLILIIVAVLFGVWWLAKSGYKLPKQTAQNPQPAIQGKNGLDAASKELDGASFTQMDSDLNQLSSDSSTF